MRTRFQSLLKQVARPAEPDAALLRRFADGRDDAAFAELVRRYGRLVWGQCRNLLPSEADADDAFQATFVTLAKSADKIRDTNKLGPWLHGVAYRVCRNARRATARRLKRERGSAAAEAARPVADSAWDAALAAVHDELHQLPETLRVPFVLCCLEGKGTTEAADQLGLKLGTFSARLTRAKQALLDRLSARGLSAGVLAAAAITGGAASAPAQVLTRAVELATVAGSVPANILSLTHGVLGMGTLNGKLMAAAVLVSCGLLAGVGGVWTAHAQDPKPKKDTASDTQKEIDALKKQIDELRAKAEAAAQKEAAGRRSADAERQRAEAERARAQAEAQRQRAQAEAERARALDAEKLARAKKDADAKAAKDKQSEFKYFGQSAGFAPTAEELEELVKRGEEGGYRFVGVVSMKGTSKQGGSAVPTLVFRKAKVVELRTDASGLQDKMKLEQMEQFYKKSFEAQSKAAEAQMKGALEKMAEAQSKLKEKVADVEGVKKVIEPKLKEAIEKAKEAEPKLKETLKKVGDEADLAKLKEKLTEKKAADVTDEKVKEKLAEVTKSRGQEEKLRAELDQLTKELAKLKSGQGEKKSGGTAVTKFTAADLGKGDAKAHTALLTGLVAAKFGKASLDITTDDGVYIVKGDPEVVIWLRDAVKQLNSGKSDKSK